MKIEEYLENTEKIKVFLKKLHIGVFYILAYLFFFLSIYKLNKIGTKFSIWLYITFYVKKYQEHFPRS